LEVDSCFATKSEKWYITVYSPTQNFYGGVGHYTLKVYEEEAQSLPKDNVVWSDLVQANEYHHYYIDPDRLPIGFVLIFIYFILIQIN
jgi:hypothetical protein